MPEAFSGRDGPSTPADEGVSPAHIPEVAGLHAAAEGRHDPAAIHEEKGMDREQMDRLVEAHLSAEAAGDGAGCVAVYTDDVEHDLVGATDGPLYGRDEAQGFYEQLVHDIRTEEMVPVRGYYGEDFCVLEHEWRGTVPGSLLGVDGGGRGLSFRVLHIWEFRDGLISRENVWLDALAILDQLAPERTTAGFAS
jgi:ketosteroid isomerase-like protein